MEQHGSQLASLSLNMVSLGDSFLIVLFQLFFTHSIYILSNAFKKLMAALCPERSNDLFSGWKWGQVEATLSP